MPKQVETVMILVMDSSVNIIGVNTVLFRIMQLTDSQRTGDISQHNTFNSRKYCFYVAVLNAKSQSLKSLRLFCTKKRVSIYTDINTCLDQNTCNV